MWPRCEQGHSSVTPYVTNQLPLVASLATFELLLSLATAALRHLGSPL